MLLHFLLPLRLYYIYIVIVRNYTQHKNRRLLLSYVFLHFTLAYWYGNVFIMICIYFVSKVGNCILKCSYNLTICSTSKMIYSIVIWVITVPLSFAHILNNTRFVPSTLWWRVVYMFLDDIYETQNVYNIIRAGHHQIHPFPTITKTTNILPFRIAVFTYNISRCNKCIWIFISINICILGRAFSNQVVVFIES